MANPRRRLRHHAAVQYVGPPIPPPLKGVGDVGAVLMCHLFRPRVFGCQATCSTDKYCARVYRTEYKHLMKRAECIKKLAKDKGFCAEFMAKRAKFIEHMRTGKKFRHHRTSKPRGSKSHASAGSGNTRSDSESEVRDVKRTVLKNKREHGTVLKRPPISCLPYELYITRFPIGEMKRRKHKVKWIGNKKMVLMPPEPDAAWTLNNYHKETAELDEVVTSGEEDSPGVSSMTALRAATGFPHDWQRVSLPPLSSLAESSTARPLVAQCHSRYHGLSRIARWYASWAGPHTPLAARTVVTNHACAGTQGWH